MFGQFLKPGDTAWSNSQNANHCVVERINQY
jgi:hypothetical protein